MTSPVRTAGGKWVVVLLREEEVVTSSPIVLRAKAKVLQGFNFLSLGCMIRRMVEDHSSLRSYWGMYVPWEGSGQVRLLTW